MEKVRNGVMNRNTITIGSFHSGNGGGRKHNEPFYDEFCARLLWHWEESEGILLASTVRAALAKVVRTHEEP